MFVPPAFSTRTDITNDPNPAVVLISAPGAVGKSMLSRAIASARQAPVWDLAAEGPVGAHSLLGRIASSFEIRDQVQVYGLLDAGEFFVMIDALDEARVKATEEAFLSFMADITTLATGTGAPKFILLGRTQITETVWLVLQEAGVSCAVYNIEPFGEERAVEYIDQRVRSFGDKPGSRAIDIHPEPYTAARNAIMSRLREALTGEQSQVEESELRVFLGYAPVLDAVATLLASTPNFGDLETSFAHASATGGQRGRPVAILAEIVERILTREQEQKLVGNIKGVLTTRASTLRVSFSGAGVLDRLYSVEEQAARLVNLMLGLHEHHHTGLPASLQDFYEEQVAAFLPEHPFLREGARSANTVFESFLFARALVKGSPVRRAAVEKFVETEEYKPSSLLAQFYFLLKEEADDRQLPAEHIGILFDSMRAGETEALRVRLSVDGVESGDAVDLEDESEADVDFEFLPHGETVARAVRPSLVSRLRADSVLRFVRSVSNVHLVVPCTVTLGAGRQEAHLARAVYIDCRELLISAERLSVAGPGKGAVEDTADVGVVLRAQRYEGNVNRRPTVHGRLEVSWPGSDVYPWTEYSVPQEPRDLPSGPMMEAYRRFRRIASSLRSHKKGALARYQGKVEHQRILKGEIGESLLEHLVKDGVLELHESFYYWNADRAGEHVGVTWVDLRNWHTGERLREYLEGFIKQHPKLFA